MKKKTLSRRMFLRGAGGATLAIPFLPSLLPRQAWGQSTPIGRRYFTMTTDLDYGHPQHWFPTLNQPNQAMTPGNGDAPFRYQRLSDFLPNSNSELSVIFGNYLNPYINKMNIFRGLNIPLYVGHGQGTALGNLRGSPHRDSEFDQLPHLPTIDQVLASTISFNPNRSAPVMTGGGYSYARDASGNVTHQDHWSYTHRSPEALFFELFHPNGQPIPENGETQTISHPRRDILSRVVEDYNRIRYNRQISSTDWNVLTNAMDQISDIQRRLAGIQTAQGCSYSGIGPSNPRQWPSHRDNSGVSGYYYAAPNQHAFFYDLYARIYAAAAACDIRRVFNFTPYLHHAEFFIRRTSTENDIHGEHSHNPWERVAGNSNNMYNHEHMARVHRRFVQIFLAPLCGYLDAATESNGQSILDNSLVHMTIECANLHSSSSRPALLIGGAAGALTTGHLIDYSNRSFGAYPDQGHHFSTDTNNPRFGHCYHGVHYNRILTTILRAMGLSPSQYENPNINRDFQGVTDSRYGAQNNGIARIGGYGHIGTARAGHVVRDDGRLYYAQSDQELRNRYARENLHFYKDSLPMPPGSAS